MAHRPQENERDPVDAVIVMCGFIVGGLILMGFILSINAIYKWKSIPAVAGSATTTIGIIPAPVTPVVVPINRPTTVACEKCITEKDNGTVRTMSVGETITLKLPGTRYLFRNLTIYVNPDKALITGDTVIKRTDDDWAVLLQALKQGYADVVVPSRNGSSDFYVSIVIK
jgi:hypothetical protein